MNSHTKCVHVLHEKVSNYFTKSNFTMEKQVKHYLSQVIKVNTQHW